MLRVIILTTLVILVGAVGASALWFRARLPPDCSDPRTIALVRQSLVARSHLSPGTTLEDIRTIAGSFLAMRFVCVAEVVGFDPHALPPGTPIPGQVRYTSQLSADRSRQEVTVQLEPMLMWEQVK